ncbi:MAG: hypothetical protein ABR600_13620 [Actinomycetota bacterium]
MSRPDRGSDRKEAAAGHGWLLLDPSAVPERWRDRVVPLAFVPLFPDELTSVLNGDPATPEVTRAEEDLLRLVARGLSVHAIALRLGLGERGTHKRLAKLRERFDVPSTAALRALLVQRGF